MPREGKVLNERTGAGWGGAAPDRQFTCAQEDPMEADALVAGQKGFLATPKEMITWRSRITSG